MKKKFQKSLWGFIAFVFVLTTVLQPVGATQEKLNYVALGDSIPAGYMPDKTLDDSYTDFLAGYMKGYGMLGDYTNKFAVPGYHTEHLLADLVSNKEVEGDTIESVIKEADLITITIGANDFLSQLQRDPEAGTITLDPVVVPTTLKKVQENVSESLKIIGQLNPDAAVYVSGYYFPFPYLNEAQKASLSVVLNGLNATLFEVATKHGATYVSLESIFDSNIPVYMPVPTDPHPSVEGQKVIADQFIAAIFPGSEVPIGFKDVSADYWAYHEIMLLTSLGAMKGKTDQLFEPGEAISRAEVAETLLSIIPFDQAMPNDPGFADVSKDHENYYAIWKLTQAGVFAKAENFNPDAPLTRAQMAKVLSLAFQLQPKGESSFKDVSANHWAKGYIDILSSNEVTTGYGDNTFRPLAPTTRAQFAVFLVRIHGLSSGQVPVVQN